MNASDKFLIKVNRKFGPYVLFKGRPRRNAFSKLVHRPYKSFPTDRFCEMEIKKTTGLRNKHRTALSCAEDQIRTIKSPGKGF